MNPAYYVSSGDINLAVYTWGVAESNKPTIVLVHGYPDSAHIWQNVAQALAKDNFVVAYDVRGAGLSSKPIKVKDYDLSLLSADLVAVLDSLPNTPKVHLVGHDWGAIQSWESVTEPKLQARLLSFTAISGPCLDHMGFWMQQRLGVKAQSMKQVLRQLAHSWYIVFFRYPYLLQLFGEILATKCGRGYSKIKRIYTVFKPIQLKHKTENMGLIYIKRICCRG